MWDLRQLSGDFLKSSLKEYIVYIDFLLLSSVCHFSYYFGSITQFILFVDEIFAWIFDRLWSPEDNYLHIFFTFKYFYLWISLGSLIFLTYDRSCLLPLLSLTSDPWLQISYLWLLLTLYLWVLTSERISNLIFWTNLWPTAIYLWPLTCDPDLQFLTQSTAVDLRLWTNGRDLVFWLAILTRKHWPVNFDPTSDPTSDFWPLTSDATSNFGIYFCSLRIYFLSWFHHVWNW